MTHAGHISSESQPRWQRWVLAVLVLATLVLGIRGYWRYESEHPGGHGVDAWSVVYHACQLLVAHGAHLTGEIPWQLHWARYLGLIALFTAGMLAFAKFFRLEWAGFWLRMPWRRPHVVICGLGDLGLRLATDGRRKRKFVVAIEKHGASRVIEQARRSGVVVMEGDACSLPTLRRAHVHQAEFVVAACADDATNVAIAALTRQALFESKHGHRPLVCRLLLRDAALRDTLVHHKVFASPDEFASRASSQPRYSVNFSDLNLEEIAARQVFQQFPLDFQPIRTTDETKVHLVVVGLGPMGRHILLQAARIGHFANSVTARHPLHVTIVDHDATKVVADLCNRYPELANICVLNHVNSDCQPTECLAKLDELSRDAVQRQELVTYAVCLTDGERPHDIHNLQIGIELSKLIQPRPAQALIYQSSRCGLAALFPPNASSFGLCPKLHAFGMMEDIYSWDVLLHESEDAVARAIHEVYVDNRPPDEKNPTWDELSDSLKDSNRHAADQIAVKLRALGYHEAPLQSNKERITKFTNPELELLAQLEHNRWCAERWLDGWKYAPVSDRSQKVNKNLVCWDELPQDEQKKDYEQIQAIPEVLRRQGRGIYR